MGLLDDAIREHLELKRLGGADPGEVAREEQEALGPASHDDEMHDEQSLAGHGFVHGEGWEDEIEPTPHSEEDGAGHVGEAIAEETVEIDMRTVLDSSDARNLGAHVAPANQAEVAAVGLSANRLDADPEESLEWEIPHDTGSERDGRPDGRGNEGHLEDQLAVEVGDLRDDHGDVLAETPDFLRDTPEQERLWFEQRPPRDFDFNE